MSDATWLKFLGGSRARTPRTLSSPRSEPALRGRHQSDQGAEESPIPQHGVMAQLSSWHSKMRTQSGLLEVETQPESCHFAKAEEITWHNPSFDQMAEALQVRMMTKPLMDPLPLEYHSHILHVIEGYGLLKAKAVAAEQELVEARSQHTKEQEEFSQMQENWMVQEARYKAEIKRLEILIHQTSDTGLEAVAIARSGSLLRPRNRNSPCLGQLEEVSETSQDGAENTVAHGHALGHNSSILSRPRIVDANSDVRLSKRFIRQDKAKSLERSRARGRQEAKVAQKRRVEDTSRLESNSPEVASCNLALLEDTRDNKNSNTSKEPQNVDDCRSLSDPSTRKQICANLSLSRHRREFSFVPGDDMPGAQKSAGPRASLERGDNAHATPKTEHTGPRPKIKLGESNNAKDGPVDGGKVTAERCQSRN